MSISIYKIDTSQFNGLVDFVNIPKHIINNHNKSVTNEREIFASHNIALDNTDLNCFLYLGHKRRKPKWANFIKEIIEENDEINHLYNEYASFLLFLVNKSYGSIYAICGGQGNFIIQKYIDDYFGIEILSRLINKEDKSIKTLQERGLTGSLLAASKVFRGESSFLQEDNFGKLFKEIQASLDSKKLKLLGIDSKKNVTCLAKASFKINKTINIDNFLQILNSIDALLSQPPLFKINRVITLDKHKDEQLIKTLDTLLLTSFTNSLIDKSLSNFDFSNKDIFNFYECSEYKISKGSESFEIDTPDLEAISTLLLSSGFLDLDQGVSEDELNRIKVDGIDEEGLTITHGSLFSHLHTELTYGDKQYLKVDGKWLLLTDDFVNELNEDLNRVIKIIQDNSLLNEKIDLNLSEDEYNKKYLGKTNTYVLHKIKEENIELCDILSTDGETTKLIHVKKGFDASIRDLCSQIRISASYLYKRRSTREELLKSINKMIQDKKNSTDSYFKSISKQNLPEDLLNNKITFVLAFVDIANNERSIADNLTSFNSNIAKYELLSLYRDLSAMEFDLKLVQISHL